MSIQERVIKWLLSGDAGSSSKAICAHMSGSGSSDGYCYPRDPSDFGRCLSLLELIPEWKSRIEEMAQHSPGWAGIVSEWDSIADLMSEEVGIHWEKGQSAPKTYDAMQLAHANGYRNDNRYECTFTERGTLSSARRKASS